MVTEEHINYLRIAQAIEYLQANINKQPSLADTAAVVNLSPHHFQRIFTQWAGVSPKQFSQYLRLEYAKTLLTDSKANVLGAANTLKLSSGSRLHDLFIKMEAMTPGEFKNGGVNLTINYSFANTPFGQVMVASTAKGICHLFFEQDQRKALSELQLRFPKANYYAQTDSHQLAALSIFEHDWQQLDSIKLHLKASPFQLKVWQGLLQIPHGQLCSYGTIASAIKRPSAARAVGTAIGRNPVAFLIPCHRVIQANGNTGAYMWGETRKQAMIGWEASHLT